MKSILIGILIVFGGASIVYYWFRSEFLKNKGSSSLNEKNDSDLGSYIDTANEEGDSGDGG